MLNDSNPYTMPRPKSSALIIIDVQKDFYDTSGAAQIKGTSEVIPAMSKLVSAFRSTNLPIVHAIRLYLNDGSNVDNIRRPTIKQGVKMVSPGSEGSQIAPELLPSKLKLDHDLLLNGNMQQVGSKEHIMYKPRWGAFYKTTLEKHLRDLNVDTLVFAGCNFPNCPRTSMYEASERDFRVMLATDAMSGTYERGIDECKNIGISVQYVNDIVNWIK